MSRIWVTISFLGGLVLLLAGAGFEEPGRAAFSDGCAVSLDPDPPAYYKIDLVSTKRVPGAGVASGVGAVMYKTTPFGISIASDGSYVYTLDIKIDRMRPAKEGAYVAWVSTPDLSIVKPLGALDEQHHIAGTVSWNKFLVIVTLEPDAANLGEKWRGPVVLRGLSRSGLMHTMAGHGPYESEPCAVYGY